jgi:8-oxo-dGTP pyrophosphatase MutT (NUDIX family)
MTDDPTDAGGNGRPPGQLTTRTVYANPWMTVREDTFRRPDGSTGIFGVVDKPDFAIVIAEEPLAGRRGFHIVEQFRYAIGRRSWEFPMGTWPAGRSGTTADLARLELREETGITAATWRHLGRMHHAPGFCSQGFDAFHATDLTHGEHEREESEADMQHRLVTEDRFLEMLDEGLVFDAATIAAYTTLRRRGAGGAADRS